MNGNWTITASGLIIWNKPLISDGEQDWSSRLNLSSNARAILSLPHFQPTTGTEYKLGILPGHLFPDDRRDTDNIRILAQECTFSGWRLHVPHLEVAGLAREIITDGELLSIDMSCLIFMHLPVQLYDSLHMLNMYRDILGCWLSTYCSGSDDKWFREYGFAFVVSQV